MSKNFDYIVIGSGLSGLAIATRLSQETEKVALLDINEFAGGHQGKISFKDYAYNNGLRLLPATDSANQGLDFLENLLGLKLSHGAIEAPPVTFEDGEIKSFLGFGDDSPAFYDEMNYFLHPQFLHLTLQPHEWADLLLKKFKGTFIGRAQATRFQIENKKITSLTVNGSHQYKAENFVYCGSMNDFYKLVPEEAMAPRVRQKMSKLRGWSAVGLDLIHASAVTDSLSTHLLNGTTKDDIGPCVGRFHTLGMEPGQIQISQWLTFVDNNALEDPETVAAILKKIKRQIKRAYPTALDNLVQERIVITPQFSLLNPQDVKLQANQTWPDIQNLWVGSPSTNSQKNLVGSLLQSELVLNAMGFATRAEQGFVSNVETTL